jgi:Tol biopolymer transport system component
MKEGHSMIELKRIAAGLTLGLGLVAAAGCGAPVEQAPPESVSDATAPEQELEPTELPVARIRHPGEAAEAYFSPDGQSLIGNAKLEDDATHQVYTMRLDGTDLRRINDQGADACAYYFPDGQRLIWTSTKDHLELSEGANYSDPNNYPQGAELYVSDLDGSNVERLTNNEYYDAEVSVSPDGKWILFSRQIDGQVDLWRMRSDGTEEKQITRTPDEQEGGSFFMPDSETILYRSWMIEDQGQRGMPMTIYTIKVDGTDKRQITHEHGTNWAPYPAPDGKHFAFVKMLPPHNFEVFLMNIETGEQQRLTHNDAFDGFPSISPDGKTLAFSSSRDAAQGERKLYLHTMDVSSLDLGPAY